jgi:exodeoxyribonuclease VII small subunit
MADKLDISKMMKRIEELVNKLEEDSLDLEANLKAFEEANVLIKTIEQAIENAELKINEILNK